VTGAKATRPFSTGVTQWIGPWGKDLALQAGYGRARVAHTDSGDRRRLAYVHRLGERRVWTSASTGPRTTRHPTIRSRSATSSPSPVRTRRRSTGRSRSSFDEGRAARTSHGLRPWFVGVGRDDRNHPRPRRRPPSVHRQHPSAARPGTDRGRVLREMVEPARPDRPDPRRYRLLDDPTRRRRILPCHRRRPIQPVGPRIHAQLVVHDGRVEPEPVRRRRVHEQQLRHLLVRRPNDHVTHPLRRGRDRHPYRPRGRGRRPSDDRQQHLRP
jgi:hypothetical protein